jgi:hypothetical protein
MFRLYITVDGHERLWIESQMITTCTHEINYLQHNAMMTDENIQPTEYRLVFEK